MLAKGNKQQQLPVGALVWVVLLMHVMYITASALP
jgi:hypothetical protein